MERISLEDAVRSVINVLIQLRERIQEEKLDLELANTSISRMERTISKIESSKNDSCFEVKISRKKSENYYS